ncbi:MAG: hypothetical protein ACJ79A_16600, partial [Gemmatimonadaceae bacterium]
MTRAFLMPRKFTALIGLAAAAACGPRAVPPPAPAPPPSALPAARTADSARAEAADRKSTCKSV